VPGLGKERDEKNPDHRDEKNAHDEASDPVCFSIAVPIPAIRAIGSRDIEFLLYRLGGGSGKIRNRCFQEIGDIEDGFPVTPSLHPCRIPHGENASLDLCPDLLKRERPVLLPVTIKKDLHESD